MMTGISPTAQLSNYSHPFLILWCDGGGPIRLDLRESEHAGVDAEFVEQAAEGITVV
jgi:hypothetical protein